MARVDIEEIIDHLDYEIKNALEDTFAKFAPNLKIDKSIVFREFIKAVGRRCNSWESVPDRFVKIKD